MSNGILLIDYELFFVAYYKHERPQHLVAGPFIDREAAQDYIDKEGALVPLTLMSTKVCMQEVP